MSNYRWRDEEESDFIPKFDDCIVCKNRCNPVICETDCDFGESFEEEDPDDLGDMFKEDFDEY